MRKGKLQIWMFLTQTLLCAGCASLPLAYWTEPSPAPAVASQPDYEQKKFVSSEPASRTAVQSAMELSEKYARLSEELMSERLKSQAIEKENAELKQQLASLKPQLSQAHKELTEAGQLLLDMRIELGKWKQDVLGFREEMRHAQKAELEALVGIMKVLGADSAAGAGRDANSIAQPLAAIEGRQNDE
jgi:septal ring factor EnvC (AmiA/AmiB activator)